MNSIKRKTAPVLLILFLSVSAVFAGAQSAASPGGGDTETPSAEMPLPGGYGGIEIGMELEAVKDKLLSHPDFKYRGEPDVSMLPQDKQELIDCEGSLFIKRAFFQFEERKLYLIILIMDPDYIDHYSIYSSLTGKYGLPDGLNPSKALWENESIIISLERPLSLKYMDKNVFDELQAASAAERTVETQLRENFINSF